MKRKKKRGKEQERKDTLIVLNKGAGNRKYCWKFQIQIANACKIFPFFTLTSTTL